MANANNIERFILGHIASTLAAATYHPNLLISLTKKADSRNSAAPILPPLWKVVLTSAACGCLTARLLAAHFRAREMAIT
jgi:hypothetical protein